MVLFKVQALQLLLVLVVVGVVANNETKSNSTRGGGDFVDDGVDDDDYYALGKGYDEMEGITISYARKMAYLAKPFAFISIVCSYVMIREVIADQRSNRGTPVTRTLFSMAVADIMFSLAIFLGTWPSPASIDDAFLLGNVGNQASCTFQGFLWGLGMLASVFFNASLSVLYMAIVRYNRTDTQLRKMEPWQQGCIWLCSLGIALYPITEKMYNSVGDICAVGCNYMDPECLYSGEEDAPLLVFTVLPWICLVISMVAMGNLLCAVRSMENKSRKYATSLTAPASTTSDRSSALNSSIVSRFMQIARKSDSGPNNSIATASRVDPSAEQRQVDRRKSTTVAMQGICYALAFLMTYMLNFIAAIWWMAAFGWNNSLDNFAYGVLMPSAGTFNFLVFARARTKMKTPEGRFLRFVLCCCSCCYSCRGWWRAQLESQKSSGSSAGPVANLSSASASTKASTDTAPSVPEGPKNLPRSLDDDANANSPSTEKNNSSAHVGSDDMPANDVNEPANVSSPGEVDCSNPSCPNDANPPKPLGPTKEGSSNFSSARDANSSEVDPPGWYTITSNG